MKIHFNKLIPELSVSNLKNSIDFYINILGFSIQYVREEDKFAMIVINGMQIMLEEVNNYWSTGELEYPFGRGINFQIEVDDVEYMAKKIKENGVKLFREIEENWYRINNEEKGNKEFLIQDPDGYLLRFTENMEKKREREKTSSSAMSFWA